LLVFFFVGGVSGAPTPRRGASLLVLVFLMGIVVPVERGGPGPRGGGGGAVAPDTKKQFGDLRLATLTALSFYCLHNVSTLNISHERRPASYLCVYIQVFRKACAKFEYPAE